VNSNALVLDLALDLALDLVLDFIRMVIRIYGRYAENISSAGLHGIV